MLSSDNLKERIRRARALMEQEGINALFLPPSSDCLYLTGYSKPASDRAAIFILTQSHAFFLLPLLEKQDFQDLGNTFSSLTEPIFWPDEADPFSLLPALPGLELCKTAAAGGMLRASWLLRLMKVFPSFSWKDGSSFMSSLRSVKSPEEIELIRRAQEMAERALNRLIHSGLQGKTCRQLSKELMELRLEEGFDSAGPGLIACGAESAAPHPRLTDQRIVRGDCVMFDIGGTYQGYHADMTRTFAVGCASEEVKEVYEIVLQAHRAAAKTARAGLPASAMDEAARGMIRAAGYGKFFTHRLGHGIGLDIHEPPYASAGSHELLAPGNVLSDEPGIYLPGKFGIRIEDLLVITQEGSESLNKMEKELKIV